MATLTKTTAPATPEVKKRRRKEGGMDPEAKAKWVAALRSGEYRQGRHQLLNSRRYCCLGVLCDISGQGEWDKVREGDGFDKGNVYVTGETRSGAYCPHEVEEWAKLPWDKGGFLIRMNDDHKKSFAEIADYIEANL